MIDSDEKISSDTESAKAFIKKELERFGKVTSVSVDGSKKTAIVRFA